MSERLYVHMFRGAAKILKIFKFCVKFQKNETPSPYFKLNSGVFQHKNPSHQKHQFFLFNYPPKKTLFEVHTQNFADLHNFTKCEVFTVF